MQEPIAVVGGGHAGHCMAADLTLAGQDVIFCAHPGARGTFLETQRLGQIELTGHGRRGVARPRLMTTDLEVTLERAKLVHVLLPAIRHHELFDALAPLLRDEHTVVLWSGYFGSLRLAQALRVRGGHQPRIAETSTVPYSTRLAGAGRVHVQALASQVLVATLPSDGTRDLVDELARCWPGVLLPAEHVVQAAFSNPNTLVHAAPLLLNVGRVEHSGGEFFLYREGITPSVVRVIRALDAEIRAVANAYGFEPWCYDDADFAPPASVVTAVFKGPTVREELARSRGPSGTDHRYLTEDVPFGLVPIALLARLAGVSTPVLDGLVALASAVAERDFWGTGTSLAELGLESNSPIDVTRRLKWGG